MKYPRRRFLGQHMLIDPRILTKIVKASKIVKDEVVYEAGAGNGILTNELCKQAKSVVSYEIDNELFESAKRQTCSFSNLKLVNEDVFKLCNLKFDLFISNLPYSRSKDAFQWLPFQNFNRAIITIQKEFADKLQAIPGAGNYRPITVITQYCFIIESLFLVDKKSFKPQPAVESEVIRLTPKYKKITEKTIRNLSFLFSQRNKKASSVAKKLGVQLDSGSRRVHQLNVVELIQLAEST